MTDPLDQFAALRPPTVADHGWAAGPAGQLALERIRQRASRPEPRRTRRPGRRTAILAAVGTLAAAGVASAATVVVTRDPVVADQVWCLQHADPDADAVVIGLANPTPASALAACSSQWAQLWPHDPRPPAFVACLYPVRVKKGMVQGGGQVVIPAAVSTDPAATCRAAGFDPVAGTGTPPTG